MFALSCCERGEMAQEKVQENQQSDIQSAHLESLSNKHIYFAHQSVGFNILKGVKEIESQFSNFTLNISEIKNDIEDTAGLYHSTIGGNGSPKSKIDDFTQRLHNGIGEKADIAALKLCYVDITHRTNVREVFEYYSNSIESIKSKFPNLQIVHFTVPLKKTEITWKTRIKKITGKDIIWEYDDNVKRNEYNEMIINTYQGKDPIFDIAKIESTYPDGTRSQFTRNGKKHYSMAADYTNDGGHLNKYGRRKVAEQFLLFLANVDK